MCDGALFSPRHLWDKDIVSSRKVATIDSQTEVFQYVTSSMPPLSSRDHCVLRYVLHTGSHISILLL